MWRYKQCFCLFMKDHFNTLTLICCIQVVGKNSHSQQSTCQCWHEETGWSFFTNFRISKMFAIICLSKRQLSQCWFIPSGNSWQTTFEFWIMGAVLIHRPAVCDHEVKIHVYAAVTYQCWQCSINLHFNRDHWFTGLCVEKVLHLHVNDSVLMVQPVHGPASPVHIKFNTLKPWDKLNNTIKFWFWS